MSASPTSLTPEPTSSTGEMDDAQLLAALLAGDEAAWRTLHRCYASTMLRAIGRVKSRFPALINSDDVAEIYGDLCIELLSNDKRKLRHFDPAHGTRLSVWLSMLARHAAYDFLRDRRHQPQLLWLGGEPWGGELARAEALATDAPDAFRVCCAKERVGVVLALLDELTPRDRQFVLLHYGQGLDPEETAQQLGICVGTVYSKKHKIRARIEGLLEKRWAA